MATSLPGAPHDGKRRVEGEVGAEEVRVEDLLRRARSRPLRPSRRCPVIPALATTTSRRPHVSTARATAARACEGSRTSPARWRACPPPWTISPTTSPSDLLAAPGDQHPRPSTGEMQRDRPPDSLAAARDERHLAVEGTPLAFAPHARARSTLTAALHGGHDGASMSDEPADTQATIPSLSAARLRGKRFALALRHRRVARVHRLEHRADHPGRVRHRARAAAGRAPLRGRPSSGARSASGRWRGRSTGPAGACRRSPPPRTTPRPWPRFAPACRPSGTARTRSGAACDAARGGPRPGRPCSGCASPKSNPGGSAGTS